MYDGTTVVGEEGLKQWFEKYGCESVA